MFKWQEEVFGKQKVLVRATRRSGKTRLAIKWARSAGKNVAFFTNTEEEAWRVVETILAVIPREEIFSYSRTEVRFNDGQHIKFLRPNDPYLRGMAFIDAMVFHELSYMDEFDVMHSFGRFKAGGSVLGVYTGEPNSSVKLLEKIPEMEFVTVDYLDLIEDGVFAADDIRELRQLMSAKIFAAEFGPYDKKTQRKVTNRSFAHLLDAMK